MKQDIYPQLLDEAADSAAGATTTHFRWVICALLFFATTINYMDRQIIGVLKPTMQKELGWNEIDYSNIVFAFQVAYAGGQLLAGRLMDRFGVRIGYAVAVLGWSLAAMGHGLARSVAGFCAARFALGVTEGGNFPAAIKTVTEWFPKRERALATGIFNAGSNVGAMVTPLVVPLLAARWGWPAAFYFTGAMGLLWIVPWLIWYRRPEAHPRVSRAELARIQADPDAAGAPADRDLPRESWLQVAFRKPTLAYVLAGMLTGPVWWFYLFWVPDFLNKKHGLNLLQIGLPVAVIYLMADVGSIGGGWISSHLIRRGWSVNAARKSAMLLCALAVVPVFFASITSHMWIAVVLIGLAAAAHQGWSANLYTFVSDTTPQRSVASVVGIGGLVGGLAGMAVAKIVGYVLEFTGSYYTLFVAASSMYLIGLLTIQLLVPKIEAPRAGAALTN
ncbi:MAG: transporter, family, hexuronate transporter [Phycisphaerales bacterium]|jgi:ACS family hexuronate transporter-like MFS transporter|nr:transporter, family, hexuronate transporter [Phycisphaerales bacterium]